MPVVGRGAGFLSDLLASVQRDRPAALACGRRRIDALDGAARAAHEDERSQR
jgi:hypothetical protein